jgi:hypothetical protein
MTGEWLENLAGDFVGWLLVGWSVDRLVGWFCWLVGWLVVAWLVGWLVGWLLLGCFVGVSVWLHDCLIVIFAFRS